MKIVGLLLVLVIFASSASAQPCPRYAQADREIVKSLFLSTSQPPGVTEVLRRMSELALLGSVPPPIVQLGLLSQRQAIENEYQALMSYLGELGTNPPVSVRPRTRVFLREVVSPANLGVIGTTLTGKTDELARSNSAAANITARNGIQRLWRCF